MPDALRDWGRRVLPPVPPLSRRARWWLVAIVAAGALLRLVWATQAEEPVALRDPSLYLVLADHVADGDGYTYGDGPDQGQTAYYPPGYPVALGAAIWLVRLVPGDWSAFGVAVEHGNGYWSLYMQLQGANVKQGEKIARGQVIGTVGGGNSDYGSHLHFEIRGENQIALDPAGWLRRR